jgi:hypothetical protein
MRILCLLSFLFTASAIAGVPRLIHHQGRMAVNGVNFEGTGQFKFALVSKGLYAAALGDTTLPNMAALSETALLGGDVWLRVWFNDGTNGSQLISPDQRLVASPYALYALRADRALLTGIEGPPDKPVLAWGKNSNGQTTVPTLTDVSAISGGSTWSMALLKNGTVTTWGTNAPVPPSGLAYVTTISGGVTHALARRGDGSVVSWGNGPAVPAGLPAATAVAAGQNHSLALLTGGTVQAWGDNTFQQTTVPAGLTNVKTIAAGYDHNLALTTAGAVIAWGWDSGGQSTVPSLLSGVKSVAAGYAFSMALLADGRLRVWGDNADNQSLIPAAATYVTAIAAGASHALSLRADLIPAQVARLDQDNVFTSKNGFGRTPVTNRLEVEGQASKTIAGNWAANSDRRIKDDIQPITGALKKLDGVRLVDFRYTADYRAAHPGIGDTRYLNVVAQEFAEVFPDHVKSSGEKLPDGSDILQVDTYPLTIYSAAAIQELHSENKALKQKLAEQEARLSKLEALLAK